MRIRKQVTTAVGVVMVAGFAVMGATPALAATDVDDSGMIAVTDVVVENPGPITEDVEHHPIEAEAITEGASPDAEAVEASKLAEPVISEPAGPATEETVEQVQQPNPIPEESRDDIPVVAPETSAEDEAEAEDESETASSYQTDEPLNWFPESQSVLPPFWVASTAGPGEQAVDCADPHDAAVSTASTREAAGVQSTVAYSIIQWDTGQNSGRVSFDLIGSECGRLWGLSISDRIYGVDDALGEVFVARDGQVSIDIDALTAVNEERGFSASVLPLYVERADGTTISVDMNVSRTLTVPVPPVVEEPSPLPTPDPVVSQPVTPELKFEPLETEFPPPARSISVVPTTGRLAYTGSDADHTTPFVAAFLLLSVGLGMLVRQKRPSDSSHIAGAGLQSQALLNAD